MGVKKVGFPRGGENQLLNSFTGMPRSREKVFRRGTSV